MIELVSPNCAPHRIVVRLIFATGQEHHLTAARVAIIHPYVVKIKIDSRLFRAPSRVHILWQQISLRAPLTNIINNSIKKAWKT